MKTPTHPSIVARASMTMLALLCFLGEASAKATMAFKGLSPYDTEVAFPHQDRENDSNDPNEISMRYYFKGYEDESWSNLANWYVDGRHDIPKRLESIGTNNLAASITFTPTIDEANSTEDESSDVVLYLPLHGQAGNYDCAEPTPGGNTEPADMEFQFNVDYYWNNVSNWTIDGEPAERLPSSLDRVTINGHCIINNYAEAASVTVNPDAILELDNELIADVTIKDGGQLLVNNYQALPITMEKEIAGYGDSESGRWQLLSIPIDNVDIEVSGMLQEYFDLYRFDQYKPGSPEEDENNGEWRNYNIEGFGIERLSSYLYANSLDVLLSFSGNVNPEPQMVYELDYFSEADENVRGFNLVGNPFPSNARVTKGNAVTGLYMLNADGNEFVPIACDDSNELIVAPFTSLFAVVAADEDYLYEDYEKQITFEPTCDPVEIEFLNEERANILLPLHGLEGNQGSSQEPINMIFDGDGDWDDEPNWHFPNGNEAYRTPSSSDRVTINGHCRINNDVEAASVTVTSGAKLEIHEELRAHVTIKEGGQILCHHTQRLPITMEKEIAGYGNSERGGWYLLSLPSNINLWDTLDHMMNDDDGYDDGYLYGDDYIDDDFDDDDDDLDYDLYRFDQYCSGSLDENEDNGEWRNLMSGDYSYGAEQNCYLFAINQDVLLSLTGDVEVYGDEEREYHLDYDEDSDADEDARGFNLVGNPFLCNAKVEKESAVSGLYILNADGSGLVPVACEDGQELIIAPFTALFAVASESDDAYIRFSRTFDDINMNIIDENAYILLPLHGLEGNQDFTLKEINKYIDADGSTKYAKNYTILDANSTTLGEANQTKWYVVNSDVAIGSRMSVSGDVRLILADNCTLTATKGITVGGSNSLTIYGQSLGNNMGALTVNDTEVNCAGIGGANNVVCGTITINGGHVTSKGAVYKSDGPSSQYGGAGIGGSGMHVAGGTVIINGGIVDAYSGRFSAAIGGGYQSKTADITINGGTVSATSTTNAAAIGSGQMANSGDYSKCTLNITINGGNVTATSSSMGSAIGSGYCAQNWGSVNINGGNITARCTSTNAGAGIGNANNSSGGNINLSWTNYSDRITASSYKGTVNIESGKPFTDGSSNIYEGTLTDEQKNTIAGKTLKPYRTVFPGDVNGDGEVNVTDVTLLVNHILSKPNTVFVAENADVNGDNIINITDVTSMVNIILSNNSNNE